MNAPVKVDINQRVAQYVQLRDLIKQKDDEHKKKMAPYRETLEQLNGALLQHLQAQGAESVSTAAGTVYRTEKRSASIADQTAFWTYVVSTGQWDLLDRRANVTAVYDYIQQQVEAAKEDPSITPQPPPGINFSVSHVVGVRRK